MASHQKIKYRVALCLLLLCTSGSTLWSRVITDMAGRRVNIPDNITRVLPYDNKTNALIYPIAGNMMIAKARAMESPNLKYIAKDFLAKKEIDTKNAEEVLRVKPQIIIVGAFVDEKEDLSQYILFAKRVNIPLVIAGLDLMHLDKTYEFLGNLLGKQPEAKACADFIRSVYQEAAKIKKDKHVPGRGFVANDNNGLRTAPQGSKHAQLFDVMGIPNAAKGSLDAKGFSSVNMEQVLAWNPDYIFCIGKGSDSPYRTILKSALWKTVTAVKNRRCFFVPCEPYLWFDMPPSVNRILGMIWFSDIFYRQPSSVTKAKVVRFYQLFYHYNLKDSEYAHLFKWQ